MQAERVCKVGNATVRIHGSTDPEKLREATKNYLKKVERSKKLKAKKGA